MRQILRSERVKLPRVHRVWKGGTLHKYHRVTRVKLPVDVPEDHPAFVAAWTAEEARRPAPRESGTGTITAAWRAFKTTARWRNLGTVYRATMTRHAEAALVQYGEAPIADLRAAHITADLAKLDPHPANARLKMWRLLCGYAKASGLSRVNATDGIRKQRGKPAQKRAPWDAAEVAKYRATWAVGTPQWKCFELLYWTGARTNDAVRLSRSMVDAGGFLVFRQSKTGHEALVPWTSALPDWAAHMEADREALHQSLDGRGFTFLEVGGRCRSAKGLSNLISAAAEKAGITGKTAHGLRATRLTLIAEAGGSAHAIMSWGGHRTLSEAEQYTREADRRRVLSGTERKPNPVNLSVNQK